MQTIITKYLGPTTVRGSRVKAWTSYGKASVTLGFDHALSDNENHALAAKTLAAKLDWAGRWVEGGAEKGRGNVYVLDAGSGFQIEERVRQGIWK